MKLDNKQIDKVASLARLELTEDEKKEFTQQLSDIITYVEKINEMDTTSVIPADHIEDIKNVFHADTVKESIERDTIESFAPRFENGHFVVPQIIDQA